ncbi:DUF2007 domain-containing protein [Vibrio japonicus]|uniref:DUF2007 domain-containing protein n=1 Tax=Vibrio japonicus TaxID=1824638 RepID=A0ABY5LCG3_9VIBR|nr:DUF2007 domain-containing protein [Vibrio japonicus]UUM29739.1 DUF2007 domain-containing protein [Vibrio japonicus]
MKVFTANTPPEAHIVCELLKSHGVECEVRGEGIFGLQGEIPFGEHSEPYVWLLDKHQLGIAQEVILQYQTPTIGNAWVCNGCGERNEAQFGVCWNCGAVSPI